MKQPVLIASGLVISQNFIESHTTSASILPTYKAAETIFLQLVTQCTIYFFGDPEDTALFHQFHHICNTASNEPATGERPYCASLQSSTDKALEHNYMFFGLCNPPFINDTVTMVVTSYVAFKYFGKCNVLLQLLPDTSSIPQVSPDLYPNWV